MDSPASEASPPPPAPNGLHAATEEVEGEPEDPQTTIEQLRSELQKTQDEKESLAAQHQTLLSKVSNIRNTLGAKLKQDAVRTL